MTWYKASFSAVSSNELPLSAHAMTSLLEGVFDKGASFRFRAEGHSMHPWIRHGDIITLALIGPEGPEIGEVVAAMHPANERLLVHRIIAIQAGRCLLKGDRGISADGVFPFQALLGKVISIHRNRKRIRFGLGPEKRLLAWIGRCRCRGQAFRNVRSTAMRE